MKPFAAKLPENLTGMIVSFPRSGRHFTLAVLSEYLLLERGLEPQNDHQERLELMFPSNREELAKRNESDRFLIACPQLFIRTHNSRIPFKNKDVAGLKNLLITRNLYDASWSLYLKQDRGNNDMGFEEFLLSKKGYEKIIRFYNSLILSLSTGSWVHISYEKALENQVSEFGKAITHLFGNANRVHLETSIENNSISRMRAESLARAKEQDNELTISPDFRELGVRIGGIHKGKANFSPELLVEFRETILAGLNPKAQKFVLEHELL